MNAVLVEAEGVRHLDRHGPDVRVDVERLESREVLAMEVGDGAWRQMHRARRAITRSHHQQVINEVELDVELAYPVRHARRADPTGGETQRGLPPVVLHRRE